MIKRLCLATIVTVIFLTVAFASPLHTLQSFPEPTDPSLDDPRFPGFYDTTRDDKERPVRQDLTGTLTGMVQLVQSHSIYPNGNNELRLPNVTMHRAALLLVTPSVSLTGITSITVTPSIKSVPKPDIALKHPFAIPRSDYNNNKGLTDYLYSRRAWSIELPWDVMVPGLSLLVKDNQGRTGVLEATKFDWAPPSELVVHSIRLGMLTNPPNLNQGNDHLMLTRPAEAAADYFQTIPAAKFTVAEYDARMLPIVMVGNGAIYTDKSASTDADVYSGDMRESTGKSTVSTGINLANYGASASGMNSQSQPQHFQNVVAHHAIGRYTNAKTGLAQDVSHGLSGGNGILTIYSTAYNEFSHEIGHHYGLGHYVGQDPKEPLGLNYWSVHNKDSGWGFISYRNRMRANIHWTQAVNNRLEGSAVLDGIYAYTPDAMSGGGHASALSKYTHYTGFVTHKSIQNNLNRAIPSADSSTGWFKWDATAKELVPSDENHPSNSQQYYNTANGKYRKPRGYGVPVWTILGGYDPLRQSAVLYEPFRGNWGLVYDLPARDVRPEAKTERQCWLSVYFSNGTTKDISTAANLMQANSVNKLHVNIAQSENPTFVQLKCQEPDSRMIHILDSISFPTDVPAVAAPVVVGKGDGYERLRQVEIVELSNIFEAQANQAVVNLSTRGLLLQNSWAADLSVSSVPGLSTAANTVRNKWIKQQNAFTRIDRWMTAYTTQLKANNPGAITAFKNFLDSLGMKYDPMVPEAFRLTFKTNECIKREKLENGTTNVFVAFSTFCTGAKEELWVVDGYGAIHSAEDYSQCLKVETGGSQTVACGGASSPAFRSQANGTLLSLSNNRCLDIEGGLLSTNKPRAKLLAYSCGGGSNQQVKPFTPNTNEFFMGLTNPNLVTLGSMILT